MIFNLWIFKYFKIFKIIFNLEFNSTKDTVVLVLCLINFLIKSYLKKLYDDIVFQKIWHTLCHAKDKKIILILLVKILIIIIETIMINLKYLKDSKIENHKNVL